MSVIVRCQYCHRVVIRKRWCRDCSDAKHALAAAAAADFAIRAKLYPESDVVQILPPPHPDLTRSSTPPGLAPPDPTRSRGSIIAGRYQLAERLGAGGTATVFRARDLLREQEVALKILHQALAEDDAMTERFRREGLRVEGFRHPNIVRTFDQGVSGDIHYIVMEYVRGRSLRTLIASAARLDVSRAIDVALEILEAMRFIHSRGIIHRDLKASNVIVDAQGHVKVTDFGIASGRTSELTPPGSILGTAQYLAPERVLGEPASEASDIYALGVILYELLTRRLPFEAEFVSTLALKHLGETPLPPRQLNQCVTPGLDAAVMRALEKSPADRFPDARSFIGALSLETDRLRNATAQSAIAA